MIKVLDKNKVVKYAFPEASWSYSKRRNEGGDVRVTIPRAHYDVVTSTLNDRDLAKFTVIAYFVELYENDLKVATAKVTSRDIQDDAIEVAAVTEEILLDRVVTPENYGLVYQNWDLADVARDLAYPFYPLKVKFESDWTGRLVSQSNVDFVRESDVVMLADAGGGEFFTPGEFIIRFEKSEVPDFDNWGRFRWSADFAPPVAVWVSYRYGETTGTMGAFSTPIRGALTEEKGIEIATLNAAIVDFKFELETDEDVVTPRVFACELIARQSNVVGFDGSFPVATGTLVRGVDANDTKGFTILANLCEKYNYEFEVRDGNLFLAESLGTDRSAAYLLRATTNTNIVNLGDNDDEIINVLKAYGSGSGLAKYSVTVRDEASITSYGEYYGTTTFDNVSDKTLLTTMATDYLNERSTPKNTFVVVTDTLYGSVLRISDTVKVVDPREGIVENASVEEITREFALEEGYTQTITVGHRQKNILDVVRDETEEEEEALAERDLLVPSVFSVEGAPGGVFVYINPFINSRAVGSEVHTSTSSGFTPSDSTIIYRGGETRVWVTTLMSEVTYYFVARAFDADGEYSEYTGELSAIPSAVGRTDEEIETVIDTKLDEAGFLYGKMLAQNIAPPTVVGALPPLPDANYPEGTMVVFDDGGGYELYRNNNNAWVKSVDTTDLVGDIERAQLASEISAPVIVASLPVLPDASYPVDSLVVLDGDLYRNKAGSWTKEVATTDLTGQITSGQITDGAIGKTKFASSIAAPEIVGSLPTLPNASYPVDSLVVFSGDLYRNKAGTWTKAVATTDLTGTITETQIADDSISTPKLQAGSVTTDVLAANAVTAGKIAANTITAAEIAAGAIGADEIAADSITAEKLAIYGGTLVDEFYVRGTGLNNAATRIVRLGQTTMVNSGGRGFSLTVIKRSTHTELSYRRDGTGTGVLAASQNYDLYLTDADRLALRDALVELRTNTNATMAAGEWGDDVFVVLTSYDAWAINNINGRLLSDELLNHGASEVTRNVPNSTYGHRTPYLLIGIPNIGEGKGIEIINDDGSTAPRAEYSGMMVDGNLSGFGSKAAGSISAVLIQDGAVTANKIAADAITAVKIDASAVTTDKLDALAVTTDKLAADAVTADKIAANTITAGEIAAGAIGADEIAASVITADKLYLTGEDFANIVRNATLSTGNLEGWPSEFDSVATSLSVTAPADNYAKLITTSDRHAEFDYGATTKEGESWYVECSFSPLTFPFNKNAVVGLVYYDVSGVLVSVDSNQVLASSVINDWQTISFISTTPAGAVTLIPRLSLTGSDTEVVEMAFSRFIVRKAANAELIVDGAITTDKLAANAVTADKIEANTITAAQIAAGAIGADQIAARAISAEKLAIGHFNNLVPDGDFKSGIDAFFVIDDGTLPTVNTLASGASEIKIDGAHWAIITTADLDAVTTAMVSVPGLALSVNPGEEYHASVFMRKESGGDDITNVGPVFFYHDDAGALVASDWSINTVTSITSTQVTYSTVVPPTAKYMTPAFGRESGSYSNVGAVYFSQFYVRRKSAGELIVDGSITAEHIATGTLISENIDLNARRILSTNLDFSSGTLADWETITEAGGAFSAGEIMTGGDKLTPSKVGDVGSSVGHAGTSAESYNVTLPVSVAADDVLVVFITTDDLKPVPTNTEGIYTLVGRNVTAAGYPEIFAYYYQLTSSDITNGFVNSSWTFSPSGGVAFAHCYLTDVDLSIAPTMVLATSGNGQPLAPYNVSDVNSGNNEYLLGVGVADPDGDDMIIAGVGGYTQLVYAETSQPAEPAIVVLGFQSDVATTVQGWTFYSNNGFSSNVLSAAVYSFEGATSPIVGTGNYRLEMSSLGNSTDSSIYTPSLVDAKAAAGHVYEFSYNSHVTPGVNASDFSRPVLFWLDENLIELSKSSGTDITYASDNTDYSSIVEGTAPVGTAYVRAGIEVNGGSGTNTYKFFDLVFIRTDSGLGDNTRLTGSGIEVFDSDDISVLKLGNIAGRSGVPTGVDYGLWGVLGTGVFIQGAPKVLATYSGGFVLDDPADLTSGNVLSFGTASSTAGLTSSIAIATGRKAFIMGMLRTFSGRDRDVAGINAYRYVVVPRATVAGQILEGGSWTSNPVSGPATIDDIRFEYSGTIVANGGTITHPQLSINGWIILMEVDEDTPLN